MEKTISSDERYKRAEEIYRRKYEKNSTTRVEAGTVNNNYKIKKLKKIAIQLIVSFLIYVSIYNFDSFALKIKEIVSYDLDWKYIYEIGRQYINDIFIYKDEPKNVEKDETIENLNNTENIDGITDEIYEENIENQEELGIGGGEEIVEEQVDDKDVSTEIIYETAVSSANQMMMDAELIKNEIKFSIPLQGRVTSRFGIRNSTIAKVTKFHTGIDIGASIGTKIVAAMEGTVTIVSSKGDYGKHVKIQNGDVTTMYAHCSKINVKVGDKVKLGQVIAEAGNTGNSTGPHLHFQIEKSGRLVNPEYVLNF